MLFDEPNIEDFNLPLTVLASYRICLNVHIIHNFSLLEFELLGDKKTFISSNTDKIIKLTCKSESISSISWPT